MQTIHQISTWFSLALVLVGPAKSQPEPLPPPPLQISGVQVTPLNQLQIPDNAKLEIGSKIAKQSGKQVVEVAPSEIPDIDETVGKHIGQLEQVSKIAQERGLHLRPANIDRSPLKDHSFKGAQTAGAKISTGWTGLLRVFKSPKMGHIVLEELDFSASGGGVMLIAELVNENVNGFPAILLSQQAGKSKTLTTLTWASNTKRYRLRAKGVDDETREALLNIARTLVD